jgi:hypothetical protein
MYLKFVEDGVVEFSDSESEDLILLLIQIYELAWQLKDFTEANFAIDMIIDEILDDEETPNLQQIRQAYESLSLPSDCHLKRLMVDFQIHDPRDMSLLQYTFQDEHNDKTVLEFLQDVAVGYRVIARAKGERGKVGEANDVFGKKPGDRDICYYYHKHDPDHQNLECHGVGSKGVCEDSEEVREDGEEVEEESEESGQEDEEP